MTLLAIAAEAAAPENRTGLALVVEGLLVQFAQLLEVLLESIAILIVAGATLVAMRRLVRHKKRDGEHHLQELIRLEFGQTLALSLEFQLAADIVATAVSPSWDEVAKLGAIAGIRTFLNFFLQKEVQELQQIAQSDQPEVNSAKEISP